ncbi:hypothetical protein ACFL0L_00120 [Patescibacteria group bacterium]
MPCLITTIFNLKGGAAMQKKQKWDLTTGQFRTIVSLAMLYAVYGFAVLYNVCGRVFNGNSVFSSDPSLSWFGSWQALGIVLLGGLVVIAVTLVLGFVCAGEAYSALRPKQRSVFHAFLRRTLRYIVGTRRRQTDRLTSILRAATTICPSLVRK